MSILTYFNKRVQFHHFGYQAEHDLKSAFAEFMIKSDELIRECLVGFGCFFTVLATLLGLCVCLSTQIVVKYIVLIYPGSCIVQSYETVCPEAVVSKRKTIYSLRIKITYIVN